MRWFTGVVAALCALTGVTVSAQTLSLLKVPYLTQSESLCGGAAAAMVMRYWGADGISAESFSGLIDETAAGIRTDVLQSDLIARGWNAVAHEGDADAIARELDAGRPAIALVEDRPGTYHYVVVVGWNPRGVVLHDPARTPYRVLTVEEFQRKWRASGEWMLAISPGRPATTLPVVIPRPEAITESPSSQLSCEGLVARGVAEAQANQLEVAELTLASASACPGADARRELAGVRVLQQRWLEVIELADSVVKEHPDDAYAWQLLATARFVSSDPRGALRAWNGAGLPRVDLVQVDGLQRIRQRKVEAMAGLETGNVLTLNQFERVERQLADWPAMTSTVVTFVPRPSGVADVRIGVMEREVVPRRPIPLGLIAGRALISREVRVAFGPMTTEGDRLEVVWRFWPDRPRYAAGLLAPAPWGGLWGIQASFEHQPFTSAVPTARRESAGIVVSRWQSGHLRWQGGGGIDRWTDRGRFATLQGTLDVVSFDDGLRLRVRGQSWMGGAGFGAVDASLRGVRVLANDRYVIEARAGVARVSTSAPLDIWPAGDTGHARPTLLRAHPLVTAGKYRTERLGTDLMTVSVEGQRLWRYRGARFGPAVFADFGRTSHRFAGDAVRDADVGVGLRVRIAGMNGAIRIDAAKGLRDGNRALSLVYEP